MLVVGGCVLQSCDWSFLSIHTLQQFRSISTRLQPEFEPVTFSILHEYMAHPPTLFQTCSFNLFLFSHCLILPFVIYFQAAERLSWIVHDASDALISATGQEIVPTLGRAPRNAYRGTGYIPRYMYIFNKHSRGRQPQPSPKH